MKKLLLNLERNNISACLFENREACLDQILKLVSCGETVAFAGSQTIKEIGARNYFLQRKDKYKIIDPYEEGIDPKESYERRRRSLLADVLLTGSNAITLDGQIVNMDNHGNRVAGISFGPKKVIIAVGKNKIVKNLAEAMKRIAQIAAPLNSSRLKKGNPCEQTGKCENCDLPTKICRIYNVIKSQVFKNRLHVFIVNEKLGF